MVNTPIKNEERDSFWTGLLVGGVLGTVAGYFLGEDDKSEFKRKLKVKAYAILDNLGDFSESVKEKASDMKDDMFEEAQDVGQQTKEVAEVARAKIEAISASAQQAVEEQVAEVKKSVGTNTSSFRKKFFFQKGRSLQKKAK